MQERACARGVHGVSVMGGLHKSMPSHVSQVFTDLSLSYNQIGNAGGSACPCGVPVQNAERKAPSCEAGAACQCCPSDTDTRGASGPLNRLRG